MAELPPMNGLAKNDNGEWACPKCKAVSGDDWSECEGNCPILGSPHDKPRVLQTETAEKGTTMPDPDEAALAVSKTTYIVVCQQAWMNERGFGIDYNWDGRRFDSREAAIKHGWRVRGSDDFNIGVLEGRYLTAFDWMEEPVGDEGELDLVASALGFRPAVRALDGSTQ